MVVNNNINKNLEKNDYVDNKNRNENKDISENIFPNISNNTCKNYINTNPFNLNMVNGDNAIINNVDNKYKLNNRNKFYNKDNEYNAYNNDNNDDNKSNQLVPYSFLNSQENLRIKENITMKRILRDIEDKYNLIYNKDPKRKIEDELFYRGSMVNYEPKIYKAPFIKKRKIKIKVDINCIDDILKIIEKYPIKFDIEYNINIDGLHNIKEPLIKLNNMIGMKELKNSIIDQILYYMQNLHMVNNMMNNDFMHTVIYGPPGTGKTETAKIIGQLFSKMGILKRNVFKKATRHDLIAGYLGQTAMKTNAVIKECLGGVLFIDEAYALGNNEKRDSFAKECIDTLCEGLSNHKEELMVIIAGYENELKNCFFSYNQGLDSRFNWRFKTDDYNYIELYGIFKKKVNEIKWSLSKNINEDWFEDKMKYFKFYGRDMETLLSKTKITHGRRVFGMDENVKRLISLDDINKGFKNFINNEEVKSRIKKESAETLSLYL